MLDFDAETHTYRNNGAVYPSVTQVLAGTGFYGDTIRFFSDYARTRGSYIHTIIQYHIEGVLDDSTIDPALRPYFDAWLNFERDAGFVSTICEKPMACDLYKVAGTPDHIGDINGVQSVVDVKSGDMMAATGIQLAGYEILYAKPLKRFGLQLKDDGKYLLKEYKDRQDRQIFLSALAVYQWQNNNLRRVYGRS